MDLITQDKKARQHALNEKNSFIVQAPAGSGKTELITQRYLSLLSRSRYPEEIVAITFTNKAASEMRDRIITALNNAKKLPPQEPHKRLTWELATKALQQDKLQDWNLLLNTNRLRILTIDGLTHYLCSSMPTLTEIGSKPTIANNIEVLYQQTVINFINSPQYQKEMTELLLHVNNNAGKLQKLFMQLLQQREQWLPYIIPFYRYPEKIVPYIQQSLDKLVFRTIHQVDILLNDIHKEKILLLLRYAGYHLSITHPEHPITQCNALKAFPSANISELSIWKCVVLLLLNRDKSWRKTVNKNHGFPAKPISDSIWTKGDCKKYKTLILELINELSNINELQQSLEELEMCPTYQLQPQQANKLSILVRLLPHLVAELNTLFTEQGVIDYTEVSLAAIRALGEEDNPSEQLLKLDYQINHLLIDEFQDTSQTQFELIKKIVSGWQPNDGKTLFLVGDPMQSIYRFRQSEVRLFLIAKEQGIGGVSLQYLQLTQNFRSTGNLVTWFNKAFSDAFPRTENQEFGAITYSFSVTTKSLEADSLVKFYPLVKDTFPTESEQVVKIIQSLRQKNPNDSIAILVRNKKHLKYILPELHQKKISFNAIEIEKLTDSPEIIDLLSLTRALMHLGDKIAWLALLRSPFCGLKLDDLLVITTYSGIKPIWFALKKISEIQSMSNDAICRLQRVIPVLEHALNLKGRIPICNWIESTWIALGGPACLQVKSDFRKTEAFFNLLSKKNGNIFIDDLEKSVNELYIDSLANQNAVQILSIHKSKGLEFDHVILLGLEKSTKSDDKNLINWHEMLSCDNKSHFVLSPMKPDSELSEEIFNYIDYLNNKKIEYEKTRLLYVAATRAKKTLHLLATISIDSKTQRPKETQPGLIQILWNCYKYNNAYSKELSQRAMEPITDSLSPLIRLSTDWKSPVSMDFDNDNKNFSNQIVSFKSPSKEIIVGTIIHKLLEKIANEGFRLYQPLATQKLEPLIISQLYENGVSPKFFKEYIHVVLSHIQTTLKDERGQWILNQSFANNEYTLTTFFNNKLETLIIDRTFIDDSNVRWIIDYKTAVPQNNESLKAFYARQVDLYQEKLHKYAKAMAHMESHPIRLGLYFTACCGWCEWEYAVDELNI